MVILPLCCMCMISVPPRATSRRQVVFGAGAAWLGLSPKASLAGASMSRVPSYTMLVPLVELQSAMMLERDDELSGTMMKELGKGGIFSPKNYYLGIGGKYQQSIAYDDIDKDLVRREKEARFNALVDVDVAISKGQTVDATNALGRFLQSCPKQDVDNAVRCLKAFQSTDFDRNGIITDVEFYSPKSPLTDVDRVAATWGVWGGAISEKLRPSYPGLVTLDLGDTPPPTVPDNLRGPIISMQF